MNDIDEWSRERRCGRWGGVGVGTRNGPAPPPIIGVTTQSGSNSRGHWAMSRHIFGWKNAPGMTNEGQGCCSTSLRVQGGLCCKKWSGSKHQQCWGWDRNLTQAWERRKPVWGLSWWSSDHVQVLHAPSAGSPSSIPGQATRSQHDAM